MIRKKRKIMRRVRQGLERQTTGLGPEETSRRYSKARVRMAVKKTLDATDIKDTARRKRIHRIVQRMANRMDILQQWGKMQTVGDSARIGLKDPMMEGGREELIGEFGSKKVAQKFYFRFLRSLILLTLTLRPKKRKS